MIPEPSETAVIARKRARAQLARVHSRDDRLCLLASEPRPDQVLIANLAHASERPFASRTSLPCSRTSLKTVYSDCKVISKSSLDALSARRLLPPPIQQLFVRIVQHCQHPRYTNFAKLG